MMNDMSKISSRPMSGQIGIIVVLITAAVLTFGLSVANRVVQENKVVVDRSDSIRTFNTAETGVDTALNKIFQYESGSLETLPTEDVSVDPLNQVSIAKISSYEGYLNQGESLQVDLSNQGGNILIEWSKTACNSGFKIGLLLTHLYLNGTQYQSDYYLLANKDKCLYASQQNFINATETLGNTFKYSYSLTLPASADASLLIQPLGAGTDINISGASGLIANSQYEIESLAKSENAVSNKTIKVNKSVPSAPGFMSFALFSGSNIVK